jgi:hypothetical protein
VLFYGGQGLRSKLGQKRVVQGMGGSVFSQLPAKQFVARFYRGDTRKHKNISSLQDFIEVILESIKTSVLNMPLLQR